MNKNVDILELVDKYNLTLIKLPTEQHNLWTLVKSDLTRILRDNESLVEKLIASDVTEDKYKKIYEGLVGVRFDSGNVYHTFLKKVTTSNHPRWACFANTDVCIGTAFTVNKKIYYGNTPYAAVKLVLENM